MSQESVELARRASGDLQSLLDLLSDDVVWDNLQYGAEAPLDHATIARGKARVSRMLRSWVGTWEDFRFEAEEIIDAGDNVVVVVYETGRGRTSGAPMEHRYCQVWSFRDGRISAATVYRYKADALKAAGLVG
jgi:ketosteroid isomerase-like protein